MSSILDIVSGSRYTMCRGSTLDRSGSSLERLERNQSRNGCSTTTNNIQHRISTQQHQLPTTHQKKHGNTKK